MRCDLGNRKGRGGGWSRGPEVSVGPVGNPVWLKQSEGENQIVLAGEHLISHIEKDPIKLDETGSHDNLWYYYATLIVQ